MSGSVTVDFVIRSEFRQNVQFLLAHTPDDLTLIVTFDIIGIPEMNEILKSLSVRFL